MANFTFEERQAKSVWDKAQRRERKASKAARPRKVVPERTSKPFNGLRERRPRERDNRRLAWARRLPCIACLRRGRHPQGASDAAHIRFGYGADIGWPPVGRAEKPDDWRTVGFCRACHDEERDRRSEKDFWAVDLNLYPPAVCSRLRTAYVAGEDGAAVISEITAWVTDRG